MKLSKLVKPAAKTGAYLSDKLAPILAISAIAGPEPGISDNIKNLYFVPKKIYDVVAAYSQNMGVRDFTNGVFAESMDFLQNWVESAFSDPKAALYTALLTYVAAKTPRAAFKMQDKLSLNLYHNKVKKVQKDLMTAKRKGNEVDYEGLAKKLER